MRASIAWVLLGGLASGCAFQAPTPAVPVQCGPQGQCPAPLACRASTQRCVEPAQVELSLPEAREITVVLSPPAGSPATAVTAATTGTSARIRFVVNGALRAAPSVEGPPDFGCGLVSNLAPAFTFACAYAPSGPVDGEGTFTLVLPAITGEDVRVPLAPAVRLDTQPPEALVLDSPERGLLTRTPWGSEATGAAPRLTVTLGAGVVSGGGEVLLRRGEAVLARAPVGADGSCTVSVDGVDVEDLEVLALDGAGNATAPAALRFARWVATPVGRVAGNDFPNPNAVFAYGAWSNGVARRDGVELGARDGVDLPGGAQAQVQGQASWEKREPNLGEPFGSPVRSANLFWDQARAQAVWIGATNDYAAPYLKTLAWTGNGWITLRPEDPEGDSNPVTREAASTWYDPLSDEGYLWGGESYSFFLDALWVWNGRSWRRGPLVPGARARAATFFDEALQTAWVCGGQAAWTFAPRPVERSCVGFTLDGTAVDAGSLPQPLLAMSSAYSTARREGVVFGGRFADGGTSGETLRFAAPSATFTAVPGPGPSPRAQAAMAWEPSRDVVVLFGGQAPGGALLEDTWEFDGATWKSIAPGVRPPACGDCTLVAERSTQEVLLLTPSRDTWSWNGARWALRYRHQPQAPLEQTRSGLACDATGDDCLLVGNAVSRRKQGTWLPPDYPNISRGIFASKSIAWSPWLKRFGYLRGYDGSADISAKLWLNEPSSNTWVLAWTSTLPYAYSCPLAASARGWVLGGAVSDQLPFEELPARAAIPGNIGHGIAALGLPDGGVVLQTDYGHGYQFAGDAWGNQTPDFEGQNATATAYEANRGTALILGGSDNATPTMNVQERQASGTWKTISAADPEIDGSPPARSDFGAAFDARAGRVLIHGGQAGFLGELLGDFWELELSRNRPAVVFRVTSRAALPSGATLQAITFSARVGASSTAPGAEALCFIGGVWRPVAQLAEADLDAPATLRGTLRDPALLRQALLTQRLACGVRPSGVNGPLFAKLSVDALEVALEYRR